MRMSSPAALLLITYPAEDKYVEKREIRAKLSTHSIRLTELSAYLTPLLPLN
jgi:hypothetical protein